jgi:hypothetical protein
MSRLLGIVLVSCLAGMPLTGCVVYEPYPGYYSGVSSFDRAWSAALGGAQDAGVHVTSSDPVSGLIRGGKDGIDVVVTVARQPNGSVVVQFDAKGPTQNDPGLSDRFSRAYDARMGR